MKKLKDYFEPFLDYKKKNGCVSHTLNEYRHYLYGSLSHCPIKEKKVKDLRLTDVAEIKEAGRRHGEFGPQRAVSVFRQLTKYLKERGEDLKFDWRDIHLPKVPEKEQNFLTQEQFDDFVERIPLDSIYGLRDRAIYEIIFSSGLRIGELLALKRDEIDFEKKEAIVRTEKTGDEERVYFSDRGLYWLQKYLDKRWDNHPAIFVVYQRGIRPLSACQARKNLLKYNKKFGIKPTITHHTLRRSFCSLLLDRGATIKQVQILARHKSPRTTLRFYTKVEKRKVKQIHQRIFNS